MTAAATAETDADLELRIQIGEMLGWRWERCANARVFVLPLPGGGFTTGITEWDEGGRNVWPELPAYPTDMGVAWPLVAVEMKRRGYVVVLEALHAINGEGAHYRCKVYTPCGSALRPGYPSSSSGEVWDATAERALCRAAREAWESTQRAVEREGRPRG